jgi:hypothetical protein
VIKKGSAPRCLFETIYFCSAKMRYPLRGRYIRLRECDIFCRGQNMKYSLQPEKSFIFIIIKTRQCFPKRFAQAKLFMFADANASFA